MSGKSIRENEEDYLQAELYPEGMSPRMWSFDTEKVVPDLTWWWWWWLFYIDDPKDVKHPRSLMILWSTKDCKRITVNHRWWEKRYEIETDDDAMKQRFHGMVCAWYFDGEKMVEPLMIDTQDFRTWWNGEGHGSLVGIPFDENDDRDLDRKWEEGAGTGEVDDLRNTFTGGPGEYRVRIDRPGFHFDFNLGSWNPFMDAHRYHSNTYVGDYGFNILKIYGQKLTGTIDYEGTKEEVTGSAYFQKVQVNAPALPWYWGTFHMEDGSYLEYFMPHLGMGAMRKTDAPESILDGKVIPLSKRILYYDHGDKQVHLFKKVSIKRRRGPGKLPRFDVTGTREEDGGHIFFTVRPYSRAYWRFEHEKPWYRPFSPVLFYNEYPSLVEGFDLDSNGIRKEQDDLGRVWGNCEHTWGSLF